MSNRKFITKKETHTHEDSEGNITSSSKETTTMLERSTEPDYIKLYTKVWCEFNQIPVPYRELFLQLALRMTYADSSDMGNSQIIRTGGSITKAIMKILGWKAESTFFHGLTILVDCNAIRRIGRGEYQINPKYAGRGEWKYNPRLARGGVEDLIATFDFKNMTVDTKILWADDGTNNEFNRDYRDGLQVSASQETVLKRTEIRSESSTIDELEQDLVNAPTQSSVVSRIRNGEKWNGKIYNNHPSGKRIFLDSEEVFITSEDVQQLMKLPRYRGVS